MKTRIFALTMAALMGVASAPLSQAKDSPSIRYPNMKAGAPSDEAMRNQLIAAHGESVVFQTFLTDLKTAVAKRNTMTVARMVAYPFHTTVDGESMTLRNRWQFVKAYDQVMTPALTEKIEAQTFDGLLVTRTAVGIGSGGLWFAMTDEGPDRAVRIIAINQRSDAQS